LAFAAARLPFFGGRREEEEEEAEKVERRYTVKQVKGALVAELGE
jgi:hypothetical protein